MTLLLKKKMFSFLIKRRKFRGSSWELEEWHVGLEGEEAGRGLL